MTDIIDLIELGKQQVMIGEKITAAKHEINRNLRKEYKILFRVCDILIVLMILSNIGAVVLTKALVVKNKPDIVLVEANPVAAEQLDITSAISVKPKSLVYGFIISFYMQVIIFASIISYYIYQRFHVIDRRKLYTNMVAILFFFLFLFMDFVNDLGLYLGKLIWGI